MKTCTRCGESKPITEFGKSNSTRDCLNYWCKPCNSIAATKWAAANRDKVNATRAKRYAENPDRAKADAAKYCASHPDKVRAYKVQWRSANTEKTKACIAKWHKENPDARRIYSHNRRARERENSGKLSKDLAERLFKLQRGKCACGCGQPLGNGYHMDHILPIALDGSNTDDNIQLLRSTCNQQKHAKHPVEFMQQRGFLI